MKENLIHYRTCVCNINYHMVWSVKYRRKILNSGIEEYLKELVQQIAEDKGFTVHEQVAKRIVNVCFTNGLRPKRWQLVSMEGIKNEGTDKK